MAISAVLHCYAPSPALIAANDVQLRAPRGVLYGLDEAGPMLCRRGCETTDEGLVYLGEI